MIFMKMKQFYTAPEVEQMDIRFESAFLTISGGNVSTPSGEGMTGYDSTEDW